MKKSLSLILALLLFTSLVACDVTTPSDTITTNPSTDQTTNSTNTNEATTTVSNEETSAQNKEEISFSEMVVIDNNECTIKITGIDPDNFWGYTLKVQLENKSSDKTYMFSVTNAAINGVQCDPYFATEVAAGKKANKEINFSDDNFEENGITDYTDIEISFRVYDSNDWNADDIATKTVHVYPYGESKATKYVRAPQDSDTLLIDNEYVSVIVTGYENDSIWGYTVKLFLLNKTNKNVMFSVNEASVNGYMADPFYAKSVMAGKAAFGSMSWSNTTLEENGITTVEEIEFSLRVHDDDDWLADDLVKQTITLKP